MRIRRLLAMFLVLIGASLAALLLWDPSPDTELRFDQGKNGIWLGHKWYTGRGVRDGKAVAPAELLELEENLRRHGILDLFVHVGPALPDGSVKDAPGELLSALRLAFSDARLMAWVGARVETIPLHETSFQHSLIETLKALRRAGFDGVHFDFEPMRDYEPGYLELLSRVRKAMGGDFIISQATPRASLIGISPGPLGRSFWSEAFYVDTMKRSDQTVLMAYDSRFAFVRAYIAFVRIQSGLVADWACSVPDHELLIGLPSYEDVPLYSDPEVENLQTASLGVRAALENRSPSEHCVPGVAIYSNWVTDPEEWSEFRRYWMAPKQELMR